MVVILMLVAHVSQDQELALRLLSGLQRRAAQNADDEVASLTEKLCRQLVKILLDRYDRDVTLFSQHKSVQMDRLRLLQHIERSWAKQVAEQESARTVLNSCVAAAENLNETQKNRIEELEQELRAQVSRHAEVENDLKAQLAEQKVSLTVAVRHASAAEHLSSCVAAAENLNESQKKRIDKLEQDLSRHADREQELKAQVSRHADLENDFKAQLAEQKVVLAVAIKRASAAETQNETQSKHIKELEEDVSRHVEMENELKALIEALEERVKVLPDEDGQQKHLQQIQGTERWRQVAQENQPHKKEETQKLVNDLGVALEKVFKQFLFPSSDSILQDASTLQARACRKL